MAKFTESVNKVTRPNGYGLQAHTASDGSRWYWGTVRTPHGYVYVYAEQGHTMLSIIFDGYEVSRVYKHTYTPRGLVTLAHRFIEEQQP